MLHGSNMAVAADSVMEALPAHVGNRLNVISKKEQRYEGTLLTLDKQDYTLTLGQVLCFGTESRTSRLIATGDNISDIPDHNIYNVLRFRLDEIKGLYIRSDSTALFPELQYDTAILECSWAIVPIISYPIATSENSHGNETNIPDEVAASEFDLPADVVDYDTTMDVDAAAAFLSKYVACQPVVSLISKALLRYKGILRDMFTIPDAGPTIAVMKVSCFGTENRPATQKIAPVDMIFPSVKFQLREVKDIKVHLKSSGSILFDPAVVLCQDSVAMISFRAQNSTGALPRPSSGLPAAHTNGPVTPSIPPIASLVRDRSNSVSHQSASAIGNGTNSDAALASRASNGISGKLPRKCSGGRTPTVAAISAPADNFVDHNASSKKRTNVAAIADEIQNGSSPPEKVDGRPKLLLKRPKHSSPAVAYVNGVSPSRSVEFAPVHSAVINLLDQLGKSHQRAGTATDGISSDGSGDYEDQNCVNNKKISIRWPFNEKSCPCPLTPCAEAYIANNIYQLELHFQRAHMDTHANAVIKLQCSKCDKMDFDNKIPELRKHERVHLSGGNTSMAQQLHDNMSQFLPNGSLSEKILRHRSSELFPSGIPPQFG